MDYKICERCGVSNYSTSIHKHHVVGRVGPDKDKPENLIYLCHTCHYMWHNNRDEMFEEFVYKHMKSRYGSKFPIKVNGIPYQTKWIVRIENGLSSNIKSKTE